MQSDPAHFKSTITSEANHSKAATFLELWVGLACGILLIVWALPHTIAARNIALVSGMLAGLVWVFLTRPKITIPSLLPALFLIAVPLWMLVHWQLISNLQERQWEELNSTWLRAVMAVILGYCAGQIIAKRSIYFLFIFLGIITLPMLSAAYYLFEVYSERIWVIDSFWGVFKFKHAGVYFCLCQIFLGFGLLSYANWKDQKYYNQLVIVGFGIVLITFGCINGIAFKALNLFLITILSTIVLISIILAKLTSVLVNKGGRDSLAILSFLLIFFISSFYAIYLYNKKYDSKFTTLIEHVSIAIQLDKNQSWVRDGRPIPDPVDSNGNAINASTYERVSWFLQGLRFIEQDPLGSGLTHEGFGYYMQKAYPNSSPKITHSAWVDYTLGVGVPGLLLTLFAIFASILPRILYLSKLSAQKVAKRSKKNDWIEKTKEDNQESPPLSSNLINHIGAWALVGIATYWIIGEVSEREFIEHYFFLISLFGSFMSHRAYVDKRLYANSTSIIT